MFKKNLDLDGRELTEKEWAEGKKRAEKIWAFVDQGLLPQSPEAFPCLGNRFTLPLWHIDQLQSVIESFKAMDYIVGFISVVEAQSDPSQKQDDPWPIVDDVDGPITIKENYEYFTDPTLIEKFKKQVLEIQQKHPNASHFFVSVSEGKHYKNNKYTPPRPWGWVDYLKLVLLILFTICVILISKYLPAQ